MLRCDGGSADSMSATKHAEMSVSGGKLLDRLNAAASVQKLVTLEFDEDGIHISEPIDAKSALMEITIPVTDHEEDGAEVPEPFLFRTSMDQVTSKINDIGSRHDTVSFRYDYASEELYTFVGGVENSKELLGEFPPTQSETEPPENEFEATASVLSNRLVGVVAGLEHEGSGDHSIAIIGRDGELSMSSSIAGVDEWEIPDEAVREASVEDGEVVTRISAKRLKRVVEGLPMAWHVDIGFGEDHPLHIRVADDWKYWMAPRIPEEADS